MTDETVIAGPTALASRQHAAHLERRYGNCHRGHERRARGGAAALRRRYLIRSGEGTLRQRPLRIRLIIEFPGTFVLVTVAAGSGVINHHAGGGPISRTAAVIAPGRW